MVSMGQNLAGAAVLALMLAWCGAAQAGSVIIGVAEDGRTLHVEAKDASVAEVLAKLREVHPFELEQHAEPGGGTITRKLDGPARFVAEQVLSETSFILHTNVRTRGIDRLVVMGPRMRDATVDADEATRFAPAPELAAAVSPVAVQGRVLPPGDSRRLAVARPPGDVEPVTPGWRFSRKPTGGLAASGRLRRRA